MFDLAGKKALITGASGGIGGAIAQALHARGASLVLSGTRREALEKLADELKRSHGPDCADVHVAVADLSDSESVEALPAAAMAAMGGLDILINNAGITRDQLLMRMKDADWDDVMRINLQSAFRLSRAVLRPMMKARFGRIISISSVVGVMGNAGQANYAASKAGLIGFSKSLAQEVASRGITVNCIAPGFIKSPMTEALNEDQTARLLAGIPAGRFGEGADVAAAAVYLASENAAYVTGQTLHVNGGMAMI
ncbi:beta-ketoacyl-ACP reductase [Iodidimonas nitroreducens]|uniref:3-oxoacyl-[acyl-carrier-protein] reductase n=1 Tax=Iodidimonas nitroreducens TaxID=1236968 RepID=A0A5A7N4F0_9PROT|nr:3-oxoacyl-[acyl-carrier-protein] reductase [Iodidimonas nitroreducens]GAK33793.1 nodulation protein G [alpha proteobacterium Q-1]GER02877.1 beta-ketoacyl-ACP reductase [Iodidimonas nitroreducens]